MTETFGLVATSETPLVIADVQRSGPSTGMPTKQEQGDLDMALYAGHGEVPRFVVAPVDHRVFLEDRRGVQPRREVPDPGLPGLRSGDVGHRTDVPAGGPTWTTSRSIAASSSTKTRSTTNGSTHRVTSALTPSPKTASVRAPSPDDRRRTHVHRPRARRTRPPDGGRRRACPPGRQAISEGRDRTERRRLGLPRVRRL